MSTEMEIRPDYPPPTVAPVDPTGGRLVLWAQAAHAAHQLARSLVNTSFVPDTFKTRGPNGEIDAGNATAAIIMGDELGLSPLASLRGIYVFKGTPALYARTMRALALSHGHEMWNESSTDEKVVVCGRRKGSERIERAEWTIARARKAGYTGTNKKYDSDPQSMLQAKADSEIARKIAADVLAGVPYSVEDLELAEPATTTVTATAATKPKTTVRRQQPAPAEPPEPEFDQPEPTAPAVPADPPESITAPQLKMLHALFRDKGFIDRDDALSYAGQILDRAVTTTKDLSKADASLVIDALNDLADPEADA